MEFISTVNHFFSFFTVVSQIVIILIILFLIKKGNGFIAFLGKNALAIGFIVALSGTAISLFYSEIAGYVPCNLCWLQRIFLYPQVIVLGMALWKKDARVADYSIALSLLGALVAAYHSYIQYGGSSFIPCSSTGLCAQRFVFEYGYVTIPVMALTAFVFIIFLMLTQRLYAKRNL